MGLKQTASQTIGPFFRYCLTPEAYGHAGIAGGNLRVAGLIGEKITLAGRVFDGAGMPVSDAIVEIWQADASGAYPATAGEGSFSGFGRVGTDGQGRFHFETIKPGAVPGRGNLWQAPHISIVVAARGMLNHLFTRLYFADESAANAQDSVLTSVPAERRSTLVAQKDAEGVYRFDIRLQGEGETVFFDV